MVVGGTQPFTVVDQQGRPRPDATWGVDNTSIATIDTSGAPTLTAVTTGTATLTATVGSVTGQTQVNVLSGTSLPAGTVLWSAPTPSGYSVLQTLQAVPAIGSPDLYSVQHDVVSATALISAFTADGRMLWSTAPFPEPIPGIPVQGVPDGNGGILVDIYQGYPGDGDRKLVDLDGQTGAQIWQYSSTTARTRGSAVAGNGNIYLADSEFYTNPQSASLVTVDGTAGAILSKYTPPSSTVTVDATPCNGQPPYTTYGASTIFNPVVGPDGTVYAAVAVSANTNTYNSGCGHQTAVVETLSLLAMSPNGSTALISFHQQTSGGGTGDTAYYADVIPDGQGGALVSWYIPGGTGSNPSPAYHVTDIYSGGVTDQTYSTFGQPVSEMVLGDIGSGLGYATDGLSVVAFNITGGSPVWTYTPSSAYNNSTHILAATAGGGVSVTVTAAAYPNPQTLLSLDNAGTPSPSGTTVMGLPSPWALGNWFGDMNGSFAEFAGPLINLASSLYPFPGGDAEGQNASRFDFELGWCGNGSCWAYTTNFGRLNLQANQDVSYQIKADDPPHNVTNLTPAQIVVIQQSALKAFRAAFAPYKVDIGIGRLASNTAYVSGLSSTYCGGTNTGVSNWSAIWWNDNVQEAEFAVNSTNGNPTSSLLTAIGEGIGNNAAHEIAHQLVNRFLASGSIISGIDLDDNSTDTYNGGDCFGNTAPWVFTGVGAGGTPIHWSNNAAQSLTNILSKKNPN
jgi:hypothetical protein